MHLHVASVPYLVHLHSYFSPRNLSLFPRLLPPLAFQGKYYKYSFKQVFFAHFGCLRKPVVMAFSWGIFLRNRTWTSLGMVSFSTKRACSEIEQNKTPQIPSLSRTSPQPSAIFFHYPLLFRSNAISWKICWSTGRFQYQAMAIRSLHTSPVRWWGDWDLSRVLQPSASVFSICKIKDLD